MAKGSHAAVWPRRKNGPTSGSLRRVLRCGVATVHSMENCCVLFCFVILLFQGHVYRTNEDPISVYKGPFMLKM